MTSKTRLTLDLKNSESYDNLILHRGDSKSRVIEIEITDNHAPVTLTSGMSATINASTNGIVVADGEKATVDTANNIISFTVTDNMTSLPGQSKISLTVTEGDTVITAQTFRAIVTDAVINEGSKFEPTGGTVKQFMDEVTAARGNFDNLNARFDSKSDKATTLSGYGITDGENVSNKVSAVDFQNLSATDYPSINALYNYHTNYVEPCYDDINNLENSKADESVVDTALAGKLDNTAGSVTTDNIASKAVTSDKIANGAITSFKLANNAVSGSNIAQNQISTNHLQSGAVTIEKLSDDLLNYIKSSSGTSSGIEIVDSVDEMTDTSKDYVLSSTGTIWRYQETTITEEVTEQIEGDFAENSRLGSDGSLQTGTGYAAYVTTPFIDLLAYPVPFTLHLDGGTFIPETQDRYTRIASYTAEQTKITCINAIRNSVKSVVKVSDSDVIVDNNNASILFDESPKTSNGNNDGVLKYVRFSGKGTTTTVNVYITYESEITGEQWVDTGIKYSSGSGGIDTQTAEKIATLNNEGADPTTLTLLPSPVLDFYNSDDYPDNDYTITHLSKITYPCRADIPVPYTIKWAHNENAMRTTVAVDAKAIGAINAYTMRTYDATGLDNYPIYNLLPNTKYYYKVTHILFDGSLLEAKSGSFTTSAETIRLLNIEGTQNVRDLGGWTGLNGKKVKYGKLIRGASLSDSSAHNLILTGKGRLALAELKVQAELNLGAIDNETSISSNCAYKKLYYTNYAIAITDSTARANFKILLEWIVSCLDGTLSVSGLATVTRNVYIHCQGGCDRTGTLCFLLLGLLGVSESDLAKEYELSSFSDVGIGRRRTTTKAVDTYDYVGMVAALKTYSGDTITDKFVNFATTGCGISEETINSFRELMLN